MTVLNTPRLLLEPFADAHLEGLYAMNRLPEVMRYISGAPETREQTQAGIARVQAAWAAWGYSWWALIDRASGRVAGAACLQHLDRDRTQPHELGWRLHPDFWGQGLATEAAKQIAHHAFEVVQAPELVAIRHPDNLASAKVMERLGMAYRRMGRWFDEDLALHGITRHEWLALPQGNPA
jgi:RimJ/RimL family protein N-acetyltransferase